MSTSHVHPCPRCQLRFAYATELEDHIRREHAVPPLPAELLQPSPATTGRITVPVDPGHGPGTAPLVAAAVARQAGWAVQIVAVSPRELGDAATEAHLRGRVDDVKEAGAPAAAWRRLTGDDVADALVDLAAEAGTTLLCMNTRSRGTVAEMALGSVSEAVVRRSPVPVLLVGPHAKVPDGGYSTLLVAMDGSAPAQAAFDVAVALSPQLGTTLFLTQVLEPDQVIPDDDVLESGYLMRMASRVPASGTDYDVLHDQHPARALVELAGERADALIVMGTHGRTGLRRLAMGSVALDVVRHAPCPVLVVAGQPDRSSAG